VVRAACVVIALLLWAPSARADAVVQAQEAMKRGVAAQQRGDQEAALAEFREAIRLVPEAPVPYRYSGEALEALGRHAEAVTSYETYIRLRPDSQDSQLVRTRIENLRQKLEGAVDVVCSPKGAEVLVDGAPTAAGLSPLRGLRLPVGKHTLLVRAAGYAPRTIDVQVVPGPTPVLVPCQLARFQPSEPRDRQPIVVNPPGRDQESPRWYRRWWVWAGAAVVAGGAAAYLFTRSDLPETDGGTLRFP
jgi:tetratricopeptide (TPR) repeat protein